MGCCRSVALEIEESSAHRASQTDESHWSQASTILQSRWALDKAQRRHKVLDADTTKLQRELYRCRTEIATSQMEQGDAKSQFRRAIKDRAGGTPSEVQAEFTQLQDHMQKESALSQEFASANFEVRRLCAIVKGRDRMIDELTRIGQSDVHRILKRHAAGDVFLIDLDNGNDDDDSDTSGTPGRRKRRPRSAPAPFSGKQPSRPKVFRFNVHTLAKCWRTIKSAPKGPSASKSGIDRTRASGKMGSSSVGSTSEPALPEKATQTQDELFEAFPLERLIGSKRIHELDPCNMSLHDLDPCNEGDQEGDFELRPSQRQISLSREPEEKYCASKREPALNRDIAATLKNVAGSRDCQIAQLSKQIAFAKETLAELRSSIDKLTSMLQYLRNDPGKAVQTFKEESLVVHAQLSQKLIFTLATKSKLRELQRQQRSYLSQTTTIRISSNSDCRSQAGILYLTPRPFLHDDLDYPGLDVATLVFNPYVCDSWPFAPNALSRKVMQERTPSMSPFAEETQEELEDIDAEADADEVGLSRMPSDMHKGSISRCHMQNGLSNRQNMVLAKECSDGDVRSDSSLQSSSDYDLGARI